jgi:integrase
MGIELLPGGRTKLTHHYWKTGKDGKRVSTHVQKTIATQNQRAILKARLELAQSVEGSLTSLSYEYLSKHYIAQKGTGGMASPFARCEKELGKYVPDKKFAFHYDQFCAKLRDEGKAVNTISNHKSVVQRVLRYAYQSNLIDMEPIRDYGIRREYRDRVWTAAEKLQIWNEIERTDSHLRYAMILLEHRPIRKMDIAPLRDENLVLTGPEGPYIRFRPKKTGRGDKAKKPRDTYLPLLDKRTGKPFSDELYDYLLHGRPQGCPWLFPRIGTEKNGAWTNMKPGAWAPLGDPDKAFTSIVRRAKVVNFHMHDLKHVALSHMLKDEGWSRDELKELGIQYSDKAIDVYLHLEALDALGRVARMGQEAKKEPGESQPDRNSVAFPVPQRQAVS